MSWIQIDTDVYAEEISNPVRVVSKTELINWKTHFEAALTEITPDIVHEDKEYQDYINRERNIRRLVLVKRIQELESLLGQL